MKEIPLKVSLTEADKVPYLPTVYFCTNLDTGSQYLCAKKEKDGSIWVALDKDKFTDDGRIKPDPKPVFITRQDFNASFKVIVPEQKEEEPES